MNTDGVGVLSLVCDGGILAAKSGTLTWEVAPVSGEFDIKKSVSMLFVCMVLGGIDIACWEMFRFYSLLFDQVWDSDRKDRQSGEGSFKRVYILIPALLFSILLSSQLPKCLDDHCPKNTYLISYCFLSCIHECDGKSRFRSSSAVLTMKMKRCNDTQNTAYEAYVCRDQKGI